MSYLARLKRILATKQLPEQPTKLPKAPYVAFVSDRGTCFSDDEAALEERAGLAADRVPPIYLNLWARLNSQKPASMSEAEWRLALNDGGLFLDAFGGKAADFGWTPGELFDVPGVGWPGGLFWQLKGRRVEALGVASARFTNGRSVTREIENDGKCEDNR
jgi:hypothetical protein